MPICQLLTNLPASSIPEDLHIALSGVVASMLNKPAERVTVSIQSGAQMCRGGNNAPTATLIIWSVGVFSAEKNPGYSKTLYDFLLPQFNIPANRFVLLFNDIKATDVGTLPQ